MSIAICKHSALSIKMEKKKKDTLFFKEILYSVKVNICKTDELRED